MGNTGRIRVLHVTSTRYGIGGVERLLLDMSSRYRSSKFEVSYCNLFCDQDGNGEYPSELTRRGLKVHKISGQRTEDLPRILFDLIRIIRKEEIDIVHLHMLQATIVGGLAALLSKKTKTIVSKHYTLGSSRQSKLVKLLDIAFTGLSNRIIAVSDRVRDDLVSYRIRREKISVVHNGTDVSQFGQATVSTRTEAASHATIGSVGSLNEIKGHKFLLSALPRIKSRFPLVRLIIVGEGPKLAELRQLTKQLAIEESVTFLGFRRDIVRLLGEFDVVVHPSLYESFGIAVIEAMAAGKAVIASNVGGIPEIISNETDGILIEPASSEAIANSVVDLLESPLKREMLGANGRRKVQSCFSVELTVRKYEQIYEDLTNET